MNNLIHLGFLAGFAGMVSVTALAADDTRVLERVAEVRALPRDEAQKGLPAALSGVVTLRNGRYSFYLDDGDGIQVRASGAEGGGGLQAG